MVNIQPKTITSRVKDQVHTRDKSGGDRPPGLECYRCEEQHRVSARRFREVQRLNADGEGS